MSRVRVFTDASLCSVTEACAWAAWAESPRGMTRAAGRLYTNMTDVAEAMAILNGIEMALKAGIVWPSDTIAVYSDNVGAIAGLQRGRLWDGRFKPLMERLKELVGDSYTLELKKVKGHAKTWRTNPDEAANRAVDIAAGLEMRRIRNRMQGRPASRLLGSGLTVLELDPSPSSRKRSAR